MQESEKGIELLHTANETVFHFNLIRIYKSPEQISSHLSELDPVFLGISLSGQLNLYPVTSPPDDLNHSGVYLLMCSYVHPIMNVSGESQSWLQW